MKEVLGENEDNIKQLIEQIHEGTEEMILTSKTNFIKDLLSEKLQLIDYKIKKHISEQKDRNNQLLEAIGLVKSEKAKLQNNLLLLEQRIEQVSIKIGANEPRL